MTSLPNFDGMRAHTGLRTWKHIGTVRTYTLPVADIAGDKELPEQRTSGEKLVYFLKSDAYRIWRYKLNPEYEYAYVKLDTGEFAVTKLFRDPVTNVRYGDIVDFECDLQDRKLLRELFLKACVSLKGEGAEAITTWALPLTPLSEVVESMGFTETQPERYFCLKVMKPGMEHVYDFSRWHLVQADAEIY